MQYIEWLILNDHVQPSLIAGVLETEKCQLETEKCQLETEKCQFETEKCQFNTEKCEFDVQADMERAVALSMAEFADSRLFEDISPVAR